MGVRIGSWMRLFERLKEYQGYGLMVVPAAGSSRRGMLAEDRGTRVR